MSVALRVTAMGGIATRAALLASFTRLEVDHALAAGEIVADARGRYALPVTDDAVRLAHEMSGVLSLTSAALDHGWEVLRVPDRPHVIVPKKRKVSPERQARCHLHRADLRVQDIRGIATSFELTLVQCLRSLPFDEGLAVADSAMRHGVPPATFARIARQVQGPGSPQVRAIAAAARLEAANPFESALRAIAHSVAGLRVEPQVKVRTSQTEVRPDLVDAELGIILEADSFEWHGDRDALAKDCRRYNLMVVDGWLVLRFAWEHVMFDQEYVRSVLVGVVAYVTGRTEVRFPGRRAA